jgi:hypothetical protein
MTITILSVNLLTSKISELVVNYKTHYKPLTYTLIAMGITTLILYPLYTHLEKWLSELSANIVKSGKSFGGKYLGLLIIYLLCLSILFCFYAKMWYNINVIQLLFAESIGEFF